jgi:hypothetical protein
MKRIVLSCVGDASLCLLGVAVGYAAIIASGMFDELWSALTFLLPMHFPVFAAYISLLLVARRLWPAVISRAALFLCGIAIGAFPLLGGFPVYYFRLPFALIAVALHLCVFVIIITTSHFATRSRTSYRAA